MNIITNQQAQDHIHKALQTNNFKPTSYSGFFFSDLEGCYVAFDTEYNIENFQSISECLMYIKKAGQS